MLHPSSAKAPNLCTTGKTSDGRPLPLPSMVVQASPTGRRSFMLGIHKSILAS
ncbi:hypothetical protein ACP70R_048636 [Stipagrostis hirtigluma subsp. patula]